MFDRMGQVAVVIGVALGAAAGCKGATTDDTAGHVEMGSLNLPLSTQGASGVGYRLRDAQFVISPSCWYYGEGGDGPGCPNEMVIDSEDYLDSDSIRVSVEEGYYSVHLSSGWEMERLADGKKDGEIVEATLLSSSTLWVYVQRHSTRWVEWEFGIGDRSVWMNGQLNLDMTVYEDPSELYNYGGSPGAAGARSGAGDWLDGGASW